MLVTVSGVVGSGKSTTARRLRAALAAEGIEAECLNFQTLPCFGPPSWRRERARRAVSAPASPCRSGESVRWANYRRRRLTLKAALSYALKIVAFSGYRLVWPRRRAVVLNRYFYDSLVHYEVSSPYERHLLTLMRRLTPRPDFAVLVSARPDTIRRRRPDYSADYIGLVTEAASALGDLFPNLVHVSTDSEQASERSMTLVEEAVVAASKHLARAGDSGSALRSF